MDRVPYNPEFYPGYGYRKVDLLWDESKGEGVWCLLSPQEQGMYDDPECYGISWVILCNASHHCSSLQAGTRIPIRYQGPYRPQVDFPWLESQELPINP